MDCGLKDRAVLITGATANIGAATAIAFGREGARVALTYHCNKAAAENVARAVEDAGGTAYVVPFDLEDPEGASRLVDDVVKRWNGLDVLVNNAVRWADSGPGPMETTFDETADWEKLLNANLTGHMRVIHRAIPVLRKSDAGRIVTLSTSVIRRGVRGAAIYTAAKAGLHGLTRSLAWDVGPEGILVNLVLPGWTIDGAPMPDPLPSELQTLLDEHCKNTPTGRLTRSRHVADTIVFLASSANGSITGEAVWVTGGFG
jgi:NAD(P)-dependent dehydrogenase (short-subunit alcohol dehydrogenase family)